MKIMKRWMWHSKKSKKSSLWKSLLRIKSSQRLSLLFSKAMKLRRQIKSQARASLNLRKVALKTKMMVMTTKTTKTTKVTGAIAMMMKLTSKRSKPIRQSVHQQKLLPKASKT